MNAERAVLRYVSQRRRDELLALDPFEGIGIVSAAGFLETVSR